MSAIAAIGKNFALWLGCGQQMKKYWKRGEKKTERRIAAVCTIKKIRPGKNNSRDTAEEPKEHELASGVCIRKGEEQH